MALCMCVKVKMLGKFFVKKERGPGGGAPVKFLLATPFRLSLSVGNNSAYSSSLSFFEKGFWYSFTF